MDSTWSTKNFSQDQKLLEMKLNRKPTLPLKELKPWQWLAFFSSASISKPIESFGNLHKGTLLEIELLKLELDNEPEPY